MRRRVGRHRRTSVPAPTAWHATAGSRRRRVGASGRSRPARCTPSWRPGAAALAFANSRSGSARKIQSSSCNCGRRRGCGSARRARGPTPRSRRSAAPARIVDARHVLVEMSATEDSRALFVEGLRVWVYEPGGAARRRRLKPSFCSGTNGQAAMAPSMSCQAGAEVSGSVGGGDQMRTGQSTTPSDCAMRTASYRSLTPVLR